MTVTFSVTQEDIDAGLPIDCKNCAVARAGRRALPDHELLVTHSHVSMIVDRRHLQIDLPAWVSDRIRAYDSTGKMEPFSFDLDLDFMKPTVP